MKMNEAKNDTAPGSVLMRVIRNIAMVAMCAFLMSACATTTGPSSSVAKRAQDRWDALLAGDFETAYQFYSPGFRSSHSRGDFEVSMRLRKVQYRGAEYVGEECEAERCKLQFKVQYQVASPVPGLDTWESKTTLDETWVKTQGQWWYIAEND